MFGAPVALLALLEASEGQLCMGHKERAFSVTRQSRLHVFARHSFCVLGVEPTARLPPKEKALPLFSTYLPNSNGYLWFMTLISKKSI